MRTPAIVATTMLLGFNFASSEVAADYRGPWGGETTVAQILKKPKDDAQVLLRGVLAQKIGAKTYLFRDSTGEIRVEIKDKLFPVEPLDEKTQVEIAGEVEKDRGKPVQIDVDMMQIPTAPSK